jgi:hypothetical protein
MKKNDSEKAIRALCHEWRTAMNLTDTPESTLSFSSFWSWVRQNYSTYLSFRTTTSVEYDVEMWFDDEFKQNWAR